MNNTAQKIVGIFEEFKMPSTAIDQFNTGGREKLAESIDAFVGRGQTIEFAMLGFPFKSTNHRDKTIGELPDLAEEVAFRNFRDFHQRVKAEYAPGARITVVSDGFIFNDLMGADDKIVDSYHEVNTSWAKDAGVQLLSLRDFFSSSTTNSGMREKVLGSFGIDEIELERRILYDANVQELYRGMIRFMTGDIAIREFTSNSQLHKAAKKLAREMMLRNEAYSQFMAHELKSRTDYIRLSMHHSTNNGTKYSFQLIPSPKAWTSPWHCALAIEEDGSMATIHRKDAIELGMELVHQSGRPYYFQAA